MKSSKLSSPFLNELAGFGLLILAWAVLSLFFPVYVLPSPAEVFSGLGEYMEPRFLRDLLLSLYRILTGFGLAFIIAILLAVPLHRSPLGRYLSATLQAFQILPAITVGVILVIIFGIGSMPPIGLAFLMTLPVLLLNTMQALENSSIQLDEYLTSIKADEHTRFRYLFKPALVRASKSNLIIGFGLAIKIVVMGEFIGSQDGLGYLLNRARLVFSMREVFFYLVILLLITLAFQVLVNLLFAGPLRRYSYD